MKNRILTLLVLGFLPFFCDHAQAQQSFSEESSVSLNRSDILLTFNLKTTLPNDKPYQTAGRFFVAGDDAGTKENLVHRVVADSSRGVYFGYDLIVKPSGTPGRHSVSVRSLSRKPAEFALLPSLENFALEHLPKYPRDITVDDGDTIALDILYNPQTKAKIVDFIKITTKKPQDFTLSAVKLRLTSPKLRLNGAVSSLLGSNWEGMIEGSIIHVYIPEKGRFIFSLVPQDGFNFRKNAAIKENILSFESNGERYEIMSSGPILSNGGRWNLWTLADSEYRPDLIFSAQAPNYIEYGASNDVGSLLKREWRRSRQLPVRPEKEAIYRAWVDDVDYIITDDERETFAQLKSDEERERFIQAFWNRRDPNPETDDNEFRRDFYIRVAYANENFTFGKTTGAQTNRGRIFITHGKPDEVQKTSTGEIWTYKYLPGRGDNIKFEFVGATKNGDVRLFR